MRLCTRMSARRERWRAAGRALALLVLLAGVGVSPCRAAGQEPPAEPAHEEPAGSPAEEPVGPPAEEPADQPEPAPAPGGRTIGKIFVDGNVRVSDSAFFSSLRLKSGDPYDSKTVAEEFRRLWDLDLFDDITVESRQRGTDTIDLIFHVRDRPLMSGVAYVGMKAITEANIQERLNQAKVEVRRGQPVDFSVLHKAEAIITQLLQEKGYLEARVRSRLTPLSQGQREVTFYIREGGKTKIKDIDFVGNTVFTDSQIRKTLKLTKQMGFLTSWASSKVLYHPAKFDQDSENIRTAYKAVGYLDINVKPEIVELAGKGKSHPPTPLDETVEDDWEPAPPSPAPPGETEKQRKKRVEAELKAKKKAEKPGKKQVRVTVPIEEGQQYKVGRMSVEGNSVFSVPEILSRLRLRPGMVFNDALLKFATKRIEDDYGERGYFYVSLDPQIDKHEQTADLKLVVTEDKKYFVDRIEFVGNTTTRDTVLRREMPLAEEDLFNVRRLRLGVRKIAQLGYFQVGDDPDVQPREGSNKVDIEVKGTETSRNEIQVGGGVSGLEGGFFQASYSTRNFLGRGEVLSLFIQTGKTADRYSISFTEPWFLGKPWTLGFSLFNRQTVYVGFRRRDQGSTVSLGRLLGTFSRFDVIYGLQTTDFIPTRAGYVVNQPTSTTSSVTNVWSIDTRNNFFHPTHGYRLLASLEVAGGPLGGDNYFYKPRIDATLFLPGLMKRHYVGLNASYGFIEPYGGKVIPTYERYFLGGERSLRLFPARSVSPVRRDEDLNGNDFIGRPEDTPDGAFTPLCPTDDTNMNGVQDPGEGDHGNCLLDPAEDQNRNGFLDTEDLNRNRLLDPGEDANGNGVLDTEDHNGNNRLDPGEDAFDATFTPFCPADDPNMNGFQDKGEGAGGNCVLDPGEDTNGDGVYGTVYPGGKQYIVFNGEYNIAVSDTVEFSFFYDAGNAFDNGQRVSLKDMRVDYGIEMRFYLPVFQAPLRLIYGWIQNPRGGEDPSNFIFSIGTTF
jgi:outer membrane protein insertion porin family